MHECAALATISTTSSAAGRDFPNPGEISVSTADIPEAIGFFVFTYDSSGPFGVSPSGSDRGFDLALVKQ